MAADLSSMQRHTAYGLESHYHGPSTSSPDVASIVCEVRIRSRLPDFQRPGMYARLSVSVVRSRLLTPSGRSSRRLLVSPVVLDILGRAVVGQGFVPLVEHDEQFTPPASSASFLLVSRGRF